jgi:hypothetical protein
VCHKISTYPERNATQRNATQHIRASRDWIHEREADRGAVIVADSVAHMGRRVARDGPSANGSDGSGIRRLGPVRGEVDEIQADRSRHDVDRKVVDTSIRIQRHAEWLEVGSELPNTHTDHQHRFVPIVSRS